MNTQMLMISSSVIMGMTGAIFSFAPHEILGYAGWPAADAPVLFMQIFGALYLGFAMLNWMARANLIGGIYSRPVAIGNFMHFAISAIALIKATFADPNAALGIVTFVYAIFAISFALVVFGNPIKVADNT